MGLPRKGKILIFAKKTKKGATTPIANRELNVLLKAWSQDELKKIERAILDVVTISLIFILNLYSK